MHLPWALLVVAGLACLVGAAVQGAVGLGLGLVASPVFALLDPSLVPGTILLTTSALPVLTMRRERDGTDWRGLSFALAGPGRRDGGRRVRRRHPAGADHRRRRRRRRARRGAAVGDPLGRPPHPAGAGRRRAGQRGGRHGDVGGRSAGRAALPAVRGAGPAVDDGRVLPGRQRRVGRRARGGRGGREPGGRPGRWCCFPSSVSGFLLSGPLRSPRRGSGPAGWRSCCCRRAAPSCSSCARSSRVGR